MFQYAILVGILILAEIALIVYCVVLPVQVVLDFHSIFCTIYPISCSPIKSIIRYDLFYTFKWIMIVEDLCVA